jgi:TolB-like protein
MSRPLLVQGVLGLAAHAALGGKLLYLFEDYALDTERRELHRGADLVAIEPKVFDLLAHVIENRRRVVSRDDLLAQVWDGRIVSESALASCINAARRAIGDSGEKQRLIKTLPRKGVRFVGKVREEPKPAEETSPEASLQKAPLPLPERPSIAALPFTNLSGDKEQEYFSDGITEDIITELSRFSELFVIARNSSFQYKGKSIDVRQVGRELGVRYVLEGSIRRAGDRVRISAQLVDAVTGAHRWAERYDRKLEDAFGPTSWSAPRHDPRRMSAGRNNAQGQPFNSLRHAITISALMLMARSVIACKLTRRGVSCSDAAIDPDNARSYALLANTYVPLANCLTAIFSPGALIRRTSSHTRP